MIPSIAVGDRVAPSGVVVDIFDSTLVIYDEITQEMCTQEVGEVQKIESFDSNRFQEAQVISDARQFMTECNNSEAGSSSDMGCMVGQRVTILGAMTASSMCWAFLRGAPRAWLVPLCVISK